MALCSVVKRSAIWSKGEDVANLNATISEFLPNKMYVNLNVFSSGVENRIGSEGNGSSIDTPKNMRRTETDV